MAAMLSAALLMTGCAAFQNMSSTGKGATIGGGGGAVAGAGIGALAGAGKGAEEHAGQHGNAPQGAGHKIDQRRGKVHDPPGDAASGHDGAGQHEIGDGHDRKRENT